MKIAVIGYSGAGKSTFAKNIAKFYGIEVLYLDKIQWLNGWEERDKDEAKAIYMSYLVTHDSWVIDGDYAWLYQAERLAMADKIYFLNINRFACLKYFFERKKRYKGMSRESIPDDCIEKIDWEFFCWLLYTGRTRARRKKFRNIVAQYAEKTTVFKSRKEVNSYLEALGIKIEKEQMKLVNADKK